MITLRFSLNNMRLFYVAYDEGKRVSLCKRRTDEVFELPRFCVGFSLDFSTEPHLVTKARILMQYDGVSLHVNGTVTLVTQCTQQRLNELLAADPSPDHTLNFAVRAHTADLYHG